MNYRKDDEMKEKIMELCIDIFAHSYLDREITLAGNGCNSFECEGVANALLGFYDLKYKDIEADVMRRVAKLERNRHGFV